LNEDCGADGEGQTISGVRRAKFLSVSGSSFARFRSGRNTSVPIAVGC
jgi:hypothetical protein